MKEASSMNRDTEVSLTWHKSWDLNRVNNMQWTIIHLITFSARIMQRDHAWFTIKTLSIYSHRWMLRNLTHINQKDGHASINVRISLIWKWWDQSSSMKATLERWLLFWITDTYRLKTNSRLSSLILCLRNVITSFKPWIGISRM
jgi:hypothetical protein